HRRRSAGGRICRLFQARHRERHLAAGGQADRQVSQDPDGGDWAVPGGKALERTPLLGPGIGAHAARPSRPTRISGYRRGSRGQGTRTRTAVEYIARRAMVEEERGEELRFTNPAVLTTFRLRPSTL